MSDTTGLTQNLIDRAGHGDDNARRELLERYRGYLRRMAAARIDRRLAPRVDASDIAQEALADAARLLDEYIKKPPLPFVIWLRHLAKERLRDAHRRHLHAQRRSVARESRGLDQPDPSALKLSQLLVARDTSPSNRMSHQERIDQVMTALGSLGPRDQEVLVMRFLERLGTAEIAEALGLSVGAVESRQLRALMRLRRCLEAGS
jgi:RNA polymerase sigma-70 factor, ECF subfamily